MFLNRVNIAWNTHRNVPRDGTSGLRALSLLPITPGQSKENPKPKQNCRYMTDTIDILDYYIELICLIPLLYIMYKLNTI